MTVSCVGGVGSRQEYYYCCIVYYSVVAKVDWQCVRLWRCAKIATCLCVRLSVCLRGRFVSVTLQCVEGVPLSVHVRDKQNNVHYISLVLCACACTCTPRSLPPSIPLLVHLAIQPATLCASPHSPQFYFEYFFSLSSQALVMNYFRFSLFVCLLIDCLVGWESSRIQLPWQNLQLEEWCRGLPSDKCVRKSVMSLSFLR